MWKWFAGANCLYSSIVAYFGTTNVCGQVAVVKLHIALALSFSGITAVVCRLVPDQAEHFR